MFPHRYFLSVIFCLWVVPSFATDEHPLKGDVTGVDWCWTFDEAQAKARQENKLLLLKPVSFRSKSDGTLSPSAEVWRAGPLVDQRVVRLINRRFVPYYFDMDELGTAYCKEAVELAIQSCAQLRFSAVTMPTPPVLFFSSEKRLLGQLDNFETPERFLEMFSQLLTEHPEYRALREEESQLPELERARVLFELRCFDEAKELIKQDHSSEAYYLRGLIARETRQWESMVGEFAMVTDDKLKRDVVIDRAIGLWQIGDFAAVKAALAPITETHKRYQEAAYYYGLACYHLDEHAAALNAWRKAIQHDPTSAWALRLDWTQGMAELGPQALISPIDRPKSMLGRKYLSPNGNNDLDENRVFAQRK